MQIKIMMGMLAALAVSGLSGCSTPCGTPGRLCAPIESITSARPAPVVAPAVIAAPQVTVETMPVEAPPGARQSAAAAPAIPAVTVRLALVLPLRSEGLGAPANAVRAGFMAAWERDRTGFEVMVLETGDGSQEALDAYTRAASENDIVVGPLARSAVTAVAGSAMRKPTIALNTPDPGTPVPPRMLVMGLSIEDEARQAAAWAHAEQPGGSALIVSGTSAWQRRIAGAFVAEWARLGHESQLVELPNVHGDLREGDIGQLKAKVTGEMPTLIFAALDGGQVRQVRGVLGPSVPFYGTSSVNPGVVAGDTLPELDGMRLLDLPWLVQQDHSAVMVYPRQSEAHPSLDMDRLYALGIDAFRVARELTLRPGASFKLDGVTGKLSVIQNAGQMRFERTYPAAAYQGGTASVIPGR